MPQSRIGAYAISSAGVLNAEFVPAKIKQLNQRVTTVQFIGHDPLIEKDRFGMDFL